MIVEKARIQNIPEIQKLVNSHANKGEMLPRALSELYENIRDFFIVRDGDTMIACGALHVFWSDLAEIRAVSVVDDRKHHGAGAMIVNACLDEAKGLGIDTIFCLTYMPDFFEKLGFKQVDKSTLPHKIWGECLRCPKFPDCDEVALIYNLDTSS